MFLQVKRERTGFRPRVDREDAESAKVLTMHGIRYIDPLLQLTERERAALRSDPPVTLADLLPKVSVVFHLPLHFIRILLTI